MRILKRLICFQLKEQCRRSMVHVFDMLNNKEIWPLAFFNERSVHHFEVRHKCPTDSTVLPLRTVYRVLLDPKQNMYRVSCIMHGVSSLAGKNRTSYIVHRGSCISYRVFGSQWLHNSCWFVSRMIMYKENFSNLGNPCTFANISLHLLDLSMPIK